MSFYFIVFSFGIIYSLVKLQNLIGKFVIGLDLYLPEEIENKIDSTIVIYDSYIE